MAGAERANETGGVVMRKLAGLVALVALLGCSAEGPRIRYPHPGHRPCPEPVPTLLSPRHSG